MDRGRVGEVQLELAAGLVAMAVAHARHLGAPSAAVRDGQVEDLTRVPGIGDVDDRRAVLLIPAGERVEGGKGGCPRRGLSFTGTRESMMPRIDEVPAA